MRTDQHEKAIEEFRVTLPLYETTGDTLKAASVCRNIGECYCQLQDFDRAVSHHERFVILAKSSGSRVEEQRAWATIGRTNLSKAEIIKDASQLHKTLHSAEQQLCRSVDIARSLGDKVTDRERLIMVVRSTFNIGIINDLRGDYEKAIKYHQDATNMCRGDLVEDLFNCQFNLAEAYRKSQQYSKSLETLDKALKSAERMKDGKKKKEVLILKAATLTLEKDCVSARRCLKLARRLSEADMVVVAAIVKIYKAVSRLERALSSDNTEDLVSACEGLGDLEAEDRRYDIALEHYLKMLDYAREAGRSEDQLGQIYESLAVTYEDMCMYRKACDFYIKAATAYKGNTRKECRAWMNVANARTLDSRNYGYHEISEAHAQAYSAASTGKHRHLQVRILTNLSVAQDIHHEEEQKRMTLTKLATLCDRYNVKSDGSESEEDTQTSPVNDDSGFDVEMSDLSDSDGGEVAVETTTGTVTRVRRNFTKKNERGETILQQACIKGSVAKVKELIQQGATVNVRDNSGWTPLHDAAHGGFADIVDVLLDTGADIDDRGGEGSKCEGFTPLHCAACEGMMDVMDTLVDRGASVIAKDDEGNTALDRLSILLQENNITDPADLALVDRMQKKLARKMNEMGVKLSSTKPNRRPKRKSKPNSDSDSDDGCVGVTVCPDKDAPVEIDPTIYRNAILPSTSANSSAKNEYQSVINNCRSSAVTKDPSDVPKYSSAQPKYVPKDANKRTSVTSCDISRPIKRKLNVANEYISGSNVRAENVGKKHKRLNNTVEKDDIHINRYEMDRIDIGSNSVSYDSSNEFENFQDFDNIDSCILEREIVDLSDSQLSQEIIPNNVQKKRKKQMKLTDLVNTKSLTKNNFNNQPHANIENRSTTSENRSMTSRHTMASPTPPTNRSPVSSISLVTMAPVIPCTLPSVVLKVKVKVKDKLLLVPVHAGHALETISWLTKEVAERYTTLYGITPILHLRTSDGADLCPNEVVSSVLSHNEQIEGEVESWVVPSIATRYSQACVVNKSACYKNLSQCLQSCEGSCVLKLSNLGLKSAHVHPVFKALLHQTSLKALHLNGNKLGDTGVENLSKTLPGLANLTVLDIGLNQMTCTGLRHMVDALSKGDAGTVLRNLRTLDLSHNLLGDSCLEPLSALLSLLPSLNTLNLSSTQLTQRLFENHRLSLESSLKASSLHHLNVSYNNFGSIGVELLLKTLSHKQIQTLNLGHCVSGSVGSRSTYVGQTDRILLEYARQEGCGLQDLNLSACDLVTNATYHIAELPKVLPRLRKLDLSLNPQLTNTTFKQLIENSTQTDLNSVTLDSVGLTSPLDSELLDAVNEKLNSDTKPLVCLNFTCTKIDKIDSESLTSIWTARWGELGLIKLDGDCVKLEVNSPNSFT